MIQVKLIKPHKLQREIVDSFYEESTFLLTVICGRQFGKTTIGENLVLKLGFEDRGCNIMWVSPTDSQAKKVYKEVVDSLMGTPLILSKTGSSGEMQIKLITGTTIYFKSALSGDSLRGDSIHYMILDEAAFMKRDVVEGVLLPSLSVTGKKVLILTTPKGKNWVYDYYLKGLQGSEGFKSLRYSSVDSPLMNDTILKMFKDTFTEGMYKQEILAEFVDVGSVFKEMSLRASLERITAPLQGVKYWAGIDIGLITDATVVSIIDSNNNVVQYYRFVGIDTNDLVRELLKIFKVWNFEHIYIEDNNQGLPIYQLLRPNVSNLSRFNTNSKTKGEIIDSLIFSVNTSEIDFIDDALLVEEFENFKFQQSNTGHIKYLAENGYSDDIVLSVAIAKRCKDDKRDKKIFAVGF